MLSLSLSTNEEVNKNNIKNQERARGYKSPYPLASCIGPARLVLVYCCTDNSKKANKQAKATEAMSLAMAKASIISSMRPSRRRPRTAPSLPPHLRRRQTVACTAPDAGSGLFEAAKLTVYTFVKDGMVVGLGSGRASSLAIQYLGAQLKRGALSDIVGIPSSVVSASEAAKAGIPLDNYQDNTKIDFAFNDADLIEEGTLAALIGRRRLEIGDFESGQSLMEEKSIAKSAGKVAFIVDQGEYTRDIEGSIPVLVKSGNWMDTAEEIDDLFLGDAEVWRRPTFGNAGPMGGDLPLITKEGHHILDVVFTSPILDLGQVAESLERISGVVDHGIIFSIPCFAVIASKMGVTILRKKSSVAS